MKQNFIRQQKLWMLFASIVAFSPVVADDVATVQNIIDVLESLPKGTKKSSVVPPIKLPARSSMTAAQAAAQVTSIERIIDVLESLPVATSKGTTPVVTPRETVAPVVAVVTKAQLKAKKSLAEITAALKTVGATVEQYPTVKYMADHVADAPPFFNFSVGTEGFSFLGQAWTGQPYTKLVRAGLPGAIASHTASWAKGISFLMLGFTSDDKLVADIVTTTPDYYEIFVFNDQMQVIGSEKVTPVAGVGVVEAGDVELGLPDMVQFGGWPILAYPTVFTLQNSKAAPARPVTTPVTTPRGKAATGVTKTQIKSMQNISDVAKAMNVSFAKNANNTLLYKATNATDAPKLFGINVGTKPFLTGFEFLASRFDENLFATLKFLPSLVQRGTASWSKGIQFLLLAFDMNDQVVTDLTKQAPAYFEIFVYNDQGQLIGSENLKDKVNQIDGQMPLASLWVTVAFGNENNPDGMLPYPAVFTLKGYVQAPAATAASVVTETQLASVANYTALKALIPALPAFTAIPGYAYNNTDQNQYDAPGAFNINIGSYGYAFFTPVWPGNTKYNPLLQFSNLDTVNWGNGVVFVLLGFAKAGQLLTTLVGQIPDHVNMYAFDALSGNFLHVVKSLQAYPLATAPAYTNAMELGVISLYEDLNGDQAQYSAQLKLVTLEQVNSFYTADPNFKSKVNKPPYNTMIVPNTGGQSIGSGTTATYPGAFVVIAEGGSGMNSRQNS